MKDRDRSGERVSASEDTPQKRVSRLFESLGVEPLEVLPKIISSWLESDELGNGSVSEEQRRLIRTLLGECKSVEAFLFLSQGFGIGPTPSSVDKSIRETRHRVKAAMQEGSSIEMQPAPKTFSAGIASHEILEGGIRSKGQLKIRDENEINLISDEEAIVGMQVGAFSKESQVQSEMVYILEKLPKKESGEESGLAVASKSVSKKSASFVVNFPEPLPMCRDDQNRVDWILGIF